MVSLQDLLQQSRQLQGALTPAGAPDLHRSLEQVANRSLKLAERSVREQSMRGPLAASVETTAQSFLASAGFNSEALKHDLDALDITRSLDAVRPAADMDVPAFLDNEHDNLVMAALEETKTHTAWDAECLVQQALNAEWEATRLRFCSELDLAPASSAATAMDVTTTAGITSAAAMGSRGLGASPASAAQPGFAAPLTAKDQAYIRALTALNESTVRDDMLVADGAANADLVADSRAATLAHGGPASATLASLWDLTHTILAPASSAPLQYAATYLSPAAGRGDDSARAQLLHAFMSRARTHLEAGFYAMVEDTIQRQPKAAMAGGDPDVVPRVAAFVRSRFFKNYTWDLPAPELNGDEVPFWAVAFYLLRCGKRAEALAYLRDNVQYMAENTFPQYLAEWIDGNLTPELEGQIRTYYTELLVRAKAADHRNALAAADVSAAAAAMAVDAAPAAGVDPYKLAIFKLVGRCDLANKKLDQIVGATEDWMWVRLMLASTADDKYTPLDVQAEVAALEAYFANQPPLKYVHMLVTCGLFEKAVTQLAKTDDMKGEALHLALALHHYGCLRIPANPVDPVTMQLDLGVGSGAGANRATGPAYVPLQTLIAQFIATKLAADHAAQLQYLVRLPHYALAGNPKYTAVGPAGPAIAAEYAAWRTDAYRKAVAWVRTGSNASPIEIAPAYLFLLGMADMVEFQSQIVAEAAQLARDEDALEDAIFLFAQCNDTPSVFECLIQALARAFDQGPHMLVSSASLPGTDLPPGAREGLSSGTLGGVLYAADHVINYFDSLPDIVADWKATGAGNGVAEAALKDRAHRLAQLRTTAKLLRDLVYVQSLASTPAQEGMALDALRGTELVPLNGNAPLDRFVDRIRQVPAEVQACVPRLLRLTMDLLARAHRQAVANRLNDDAAQYRAAARQVRAFAGLVPIKMEAQLHAMLAQKEVEMSAKF
ncbi:nuclear pore complex subunit [Blastocladiella emersonii ATCC 22665]|nr:nuclear pore complex subunit [Blastocladiella emersonii ATCC 22665]